MWGLEGSRNDVFPYVFIIGIVRQDKMDRVCLNHLETLGEVGRIVLMRESCFGFEAAPGSRTECVIMPYSLHKDALTRLSDAHLPTGYLTLQGSSSYAGYDDIRRTRWRASIALDFVREMQYAQKRVPKNEVFLHMENDVFLQPYLMPDVQRMVLPISCWYLSGRMHEEHAYYGGGALCFVFRNDKSVDKAIQCVLARHLLQPLDWIMTQCFPEMKAYRAVKHMGRVSTRIQN